MKIGFIGTGNMGGALARAAARSSHSLYLTDGLREKAEALAAELGAVATDTTRILTECDAVLLGVKPQTLPALAEELRPILATRSTPILLISMAAGVTLDVLEGLFGKCPIIRIMPNTPAGVGEGMIVWCASEEVTEAHKALFLDTLAHAGTLDELPEHLMDAATAVMGCGPAFVDLFIEALADGGVKCGLPRDKALTYATQMVLGSAKLVKVSGKHPAELKDAVCSPGGSTIVGVGALEEGGFRGITMSAVEASFKKTRQLNQK